MGDFIRSCARDLARARIALAIGGALALVAVAALLYGGLLPGAGAAGGVPPVVDVRVAAEDGSALPEGTRLLVATVPVNEGVRTVEPGIPTDADFLYETLTKDADEVTVLAADPRSGTDGAPDNAPDDLEVTGRGG
jgi:hypothetical protein